MKPLQIEFSQKHVPAIEGLRGMAIILVILYHYSNRFPVGWIGVDLFFVISGFLITGILIRSKGHGDYYKNFIAKRTLRIFPLYYFFLILFFIVFRITGISKIIQDYDYLSSTQVWYWLYVQNWQVLFDGIYPQRDILSHFWSLAIEEQFYVFWPLIVFLTSSKRLMWVCVSIVFLSLASRLTLYYALDFSFLEVYYFTLTRLDGLATGSFLAVMIINEEHVKKINFLTKPMGILSGLGLLGIVMITNNTGFETIYFLLYGYSLLAIFFGCILMMALSNHENNIFKRLAESKMLMFFGKYSYGLYIYHFFILRTVPGYLQKWIPQYFIISVICISLSIVISFLSFHLFEKKFLKLKSRFQAAK